MSKRVIYLEDNMINAHDNVIFEADIPYEVTGNAIINEDGLDVLIHDIWVDFRLVHQQIR
ncbi:MULTISPECIES: hypothetical protein [Paenibacillus]|uniref:hypothetical protein n=1 Tax=Paenibacillus TaxID=44249 RepID=UPI00096FD93C|nr:hypothetical protein [Paenibacillus odorifer]OMD87799.1 hypothetical protein BSK53_02075 [Paenibacillus odorifer]